MVKTHTFTATDLADDSEYFQMRKHMFDFNSFGCQLLVELLLFIAQLAFVRLLVGQFDFGVLLLKPLKPRVGQHFADERLKWCFIGNFFIVISSAICPTAPKNFREIVNYNNIFNGMLFFYHYSTLLGRRYCAAPDVRWHR